MDVSDPWRHGKRGRPEHRHDVQIFRAILNHHPARRQGFGQRRIDDDLRRWFVLKRRDSRGSTYLPGGLRSFDAATRQATMTGALKYHERL